MRFDLDSEQEFFRDTTARFLEDQVPVATLRALRDDPIGFDPSYWRRGADLGWTSLLVSEANGGGSISGAGLVELSAIAYEFGRHAAPGPLLTANIVADALDRSGTHADVLADLVSGAAVGTWCFDEPEPNNGFGAIGLEVRGDGGDLVLSGAKRPVESAAHASVLLVTGRSDDGLTQVLVPAGGPGVSIEAMHTVDLTRRFGVVTFDNVRVPLDAAVGDIGRAAEQVERQVQIAAALSSSESVGSMQTAFDMTVEWAFERYSFGRPLASYQEIKHRFADMKSWLEASHAISDAAVAAIASGAPDAGELASAAKAFTGHYGAELVQDCVQLHGGIGVTFEHDLHLYLRRVTLNRTLHGTPSDHRARLASIVEQQAVHA